MISPCGRTPARLLLLSAAATAATSAACRSAPSRPPSDHFDGARYFNAAADAPKGFLDVLRWQWSRSPGPWPDSLPPVEAALPSAPGAGELDVTWIGHATMLVRLGPASILTDPIFSERASPVSFAGPKRVRPAAIPVDQLPRIDAVVVSHSHYDHLDLPSLRALEARFHPWFLVPLGLASLLEGEGLTHVRELDWWTSFEVPGTPLTATLAPSRHWSARGLFDRRETLWGAWMLSAQGRSVYFAGDTGYGPHFSEARTRLGAPDVALLPIGAYAPRWFMHDHHMNPAEAVQAMLDLGAAASVPMHYATFRLTDEGIDEPVKALDEACRATGVRAFIPLAVGATRLFPASEVGASKQFLGGAGVR
jgi:L-ascorbate metabolism protein UlaG (beta-lactamase superfamily)